MNIALQDGSVIQVDAGDERIVLSRRWRVNAMPTHGTGRVMRYVVCPQPCGKRRFWLHREILGVVVGQYVDHANGDTLDNRRANLRVATSQENSRNRRHTKSASSTSRFKGVSWDKRRLAWRACITTEGGRCRSLGRFATEEDAARAYDAEALTHFGEYAAINFPVRPEALVS